jgi:hypothetical protein
MRRFVSSGTRLSPSGSCFNFSGIFGAEKPERSGVDHAHVRNGLRSVACVTSQREAKAIAAMPHTTPITRAAPIFGAYSYSTSVKSTPSGRSQSGSSPPRCGATAGSRGGPTGASLFSSGGSSLCGLKRRSYSNCSFVSVRLGRSPGAPSMVVPCSFLVLGQCSPASLQRRTYLG